jgi:hypothetical protein
MKSIILALRARLESVENATPNRLSNQKLLKLLSPTSQLELFFTLFFMLLIPPQIDE